MSNLQTVVKHRMIAYFGHSGFLVETEKTVLLFDYYRGDISLIRHTADHKPLYVFASHARADHFNPKIFSLAADDRTTKYLLSFDIKGNPAVPKDCDVQFLDADETYRIEGLGTVRTFISTDEGVAFLITMPTETIFHAGDLNWWDWPGEDPGWLSEQETVFKREIRKLEGVPIRRNKSRYNYKKELSKSYQFFIRLLSKHSSCIGNATNATACNYCN